jgi:hypothetical protein
MNRRSDGRVSEDSCGLVVFDATSQALKAERLLKRAGVKLSVIPTPVEFGAGCGIALLVAPGSVERAWDALEQFEECRLIEDYAREQH